MAQYIDQLYQSKDYRRSRIAYRWECTFEYFVSLLVTDAFLAKVLSAIGMSDASVGIVSSLTSLAFVFQLMAIFVVQRITNAKRFLVCVHFASQMLFMGLYLLPFLPVAAPYKSVLAVVAILTAYIGNYTVTNMIYKWGNSFVTPGHRASFSAGKEMLSLATGVVVTLGVGAVMDYFEMMDRQSGAFVFAAISILIFSLSDLTCLLLIKKEKVPEQKPKVIPFGQVLRKIFRNRNFCNVIVMTVLWNVAVYISTGFVAVYRLENLAFTVGTIQIVNLLGVGARFFLSKPFGRFSDRYSYAKGLRFAMVLSLVGFACSLLTSPDMRWFTVAYTLFYTASQAGIGQNMLNITYSYVESDYFVQASAIKSCIGGLAGFGASLLGGKILSAIQENGNTLFGIPVYGQQVLAGISIVFVAATILFVRLVIEKQKIIRQ